MLQVILRSKARRGEAGSHWSLAALCGDQHVRKAHVMEAESQKAPVAMVTKTEPYSPSDFINGTGRMSPHSILQLRLISSPKHVSKPLYFFLEKST